MKEETKCYCGHTTYCDCGPETLEEAAEKTYKKLYEGEPLTQDVPIHAFKQGAKWQQERSYSEKEVKYIISEALQSALVKVDLEQWFKQFKKK
jgi:hypothetical protein